MSNIKSQGRDGIADRATLRPVGIDDWSAVRHLHATAFERLSGPHLDAEVVSAMRGHLAAPDYTDALQRKNLIAAWLDGVLVGTCGWLPSDDSGHSARITSIYVSPLFVRLGLGRRLVRDAESRARLAGFRTFTARATETSVAFFRALGYEVTSHGVSTRGGDLPLPITFLRRSDGARLEPVAERARPAVNRDVEAAEIVAPAAGERMVLTGRER